MKKLFLILLLILLINTSCFAPLEPEVFIDNFSMEDTAEKEQVDYLKIDTPSPLWSDDTTIIIDKINVNEKLKRADVKDETSNLSELDEYPIWISTTSFFGDSGLSAIIGHRQWGITPKVFAKLDELEFGDIVFINEFKYIVQYTETIDTEEIYKAYDDLNKQFYENNISGLMLITCTPYGTSLKRLFVIAKEEVK